MVFELTHVRGKGSLARLLARRGTRIALIRSAIEPEVGDSTFRLPETMDTRSSNWPSSARHPHFDADSSSDILRHHSDQVTRRCAA
jgi:hypothetical protein